MNRREEQWQFNKEEYQKQEKINVEHTTS